MELDFTLSRWQTGQDGGTWLSFLVTEPIKAKKFCAEREDKVYTATLKEYRKKRSLEANRYCWTLCGKLAGKLNLSPIEIYRHNIRDIEGNRIALPIRDDALETWTKNWESKGLGWMCDEIGKSKLDGYTNVICYYGSSTYDTRQMSQLIDSIITECKAQGIETATPDEIAKMKARWADA